MEETKNVKTVDADGNIKTYELPALAWVYASELDGEYTSERVKSLWLGAYFILPISRKLVQVLDIR